jgi:hypothetical protein
MERSDIRERRHLGFPDVAPLHPGYGNYLLALKNSRNNVAASLSPTAE